MVVFLISGLWHGASWTFVIWGGLHGLYMIASILLERLKPKFLTRIELPKLNPSLIHFIQISLIFNLVAFGWIFFRANSISDAIYIASHLFTGIQLRSGYGLNLGGTFEIIIISASILVLLLVDYLYERGFTWEFLSSKPLLVRWIVYYILIFSIILLGKLGTTEFIYFKF
jgi:D-alanyl-lipoteichoic acid acyltransferase DltB (MBOAT superfamily)